METSINKFDSADIVAAVRSIKSAILTSRYNAARLANREQLSLYFYVGEYISVKSRAAKWGSNAIVSISKLLQQELPGLKGFSESGIKRMRTFYEGWYKYVSNCSTLSDDSGSYSDSLLLANRPMVLDDFSEQEIEWFLVSDFLTTTIF